jgi:hypothetical protein
MCRSNRQLPSSAVSRRALVEKSMVDGNGPEYKPEEEPAHWSPLDGLQLVFVILACLGGFFYFRGPAANEAQTVFRLGIIVGAMFGLAVVTILKYVKHGRL